MHDDNNERSLVPDVLLGYNIMKRTLLIYGLYIDIDVVNKVLCF